MALLSSPRRFQVQRSLPVIAMRMLLWGVLVCWLNVSSAVAQIQLDRFFPPAVGTGQSLVIQAEGKFPKWPVEIMVDRDDVSIRAEKDSGKLKVEVAAEAPPGIVWVRAFDADSASALVPLLIEPTAPKEEVEPNQTLDEATELQMPCSVAGRLSKSGEVDTFRVSVKAGRTLVVSVIANEILGSPMDAVLQLVNEAGHVLRQADDQRGLDPQLVYPVAEDADLYVRLFAFPETPNSTIGFAGAATFVYELRATTDAFVDHVLPLSGESDKADRFEVQGWNLADAAGVRQQKVNRLGGAAIHVPESLGWQYLDTNAAGQNHFIESEELTVVEKLPCSFSGRISAAGEVDRVQISVNKGAKYRVVAHARRSGMILDSVLRVIDLQDGKELARNDDKKRGEYDASVDFTAGHTGQIEVQVSDLVDGFGMRHAYTLVATEVEPAVEVTLAEEHFVLKAGESLELPVSIARLDGYALQLRIGVSGLPEGVTCKPVVSEAKGDSAKAVKLKLEAKNDLTHQGVIKVEVFELDKEGSVAGEPFFAGYDLAKTIRIEDVWLTIVP